jgi:hypothetical protein
MTIYLAVPPKFKRVQGSRDAGSYVPLLDPPLEVTLNVRGAGLKARFIQRTAPNGAIQLVLYETRTATTSCKGKARDTFRNNGSIEDDGTRLAYGV